MPWQNFTTIVILLYDKYKISHKSIITFTVLKNKVPLVEVNSKIQFYIEYYKRQKNV